MRMEEGEQGFARQGFTCPRHGEQFGNPVCRDCLLESLPEQLSEQLRSNYPDRGGH
jgi:hypothetical protein